MRGDLTVGSEVFIIFFQVLFSVLSFVLAHFVVPFSSFPPPPSPPSQIFLFPSSLEQVSAIHRQNHTMTAPVERDTDVTMSNTELSSEVEPLTVDGKFNRLFSFN